MNEARRFLRLVTPGLVFLVETLLLLLILLPDWTTRQISSIKEHEALGALVATLLASGGVGFLFSTVHHVVHWRSPRDQPSEIASRLKRWTAEALGFDAWRPAGVNHVAFLNRLQDCGLLSLVDPKTKEPLESGIGRRAAWILVTSLWHERLGVSKELGGAEPKAAALADMIHATGTARVAAAFAWAAALLLAAHVAAFSLQSEPVLRFLAANIAGAFLLLAHHRNYLQVGHFSQGVIEQVLHDVLQSETAPIPPAEPPTRANASLSRKPIQMPVILGDDLSE